MRPRPVELALEQHPSIAEAAVGWLELFGRRCWTAFVVPAGPFEPEQVVRELEESARPERLLLVDAIPRDAEGVPRRAELIDDESTVDTSELEAAMAKLHRAELP